MNNFSPKELKFSPKINRISPTKLKKTLGQNF